MRLPKLAFPERLTVGAKARSLHDPRDFRLGEPEEGVLQLLVIGRRVMARYSFEDTIEDC